MQFVPLPSLTSASATLPPSVASRTAIAAMGCVHPGPAESAVAWTTNPDGPRSSAMPETGQALTGAMACDTHGACVAGTCTGTCQVATLPSAVPATTRSAGESPPSAAASTVVRPSPASLTAGVRYPALSSDRRVDNPSGPAPPAAPSALSPPSTRSTATVPQLPTATSTSSRPPGPWSPTHVIAMTVPCTALQDAGAPHSRPTGP